jgi:hypothetical protein
VATLDFYATIDGDSCRPQWMAPGHYLLPASSFRRKGFRTPRLPEGSSVAADWGGFVASKLRGGDVGFDEDRYVHWLRRIPMLKWAAMWDLPCEPSICETQGSVRLRQLWTREHAQRFVEWFGDEPWAWVPTIQGYTLDEYKQACEDMAPLIDELREWYEMLAEDGDFLFCDDAEPTHPYGELWDHFRVGIGSLCARRNVDEIRRIVEYVAGRFPGIPLHLWGVKVQALAGWPGGLPEAVTSVDSAAWNGRFKRDIPIINAEQARLGMTQREYGYRVQLPAYLDRFRAAVAS